uniref:hypothetical protein n=1 Tax=Petrachloros mirabilis TaxID=2918835 RepID=UPI00137B018B|nr:hypothetical protein [Petrachloros mirabilis]
MHQHHYQHHRPTSNSRAPYSKAGTTLERLPTPAPVKQWLGYPVKRTISDAQGQIIIEVGDLVTHQTLRRAWEAGVHKQLVNALYRG